MSKRRSPETVNTGGVPQPNEEQGQEHEIAGNARLKGEDPSPDDRARGETSEQDRGNPVDLKPGR